MTLAADQGWPLHGPGLLMNSGGPCSRTRSERIRTTVLGDDDGPVRCPKVLRVAIDFGRQSPLRCVERWLRAAGFETGNEARAIVSLPDRRCICQVDPHPVPVSAGSLTALEGLGLALVLGLCTASFYDPARPVLWTTTSLTRRLVLYDGGGFYA
ncbi:MAG: hypothetical protein FJW22_12295 [Acidimicrobiia bacterium]|nr:hypothetical protein [Acidimicrobiia bacterium]